MSAPSIYLGIDFAKDKFDCHGAALRGSLPNTPAGHRRFLAMLAPGTHLICESTGTCHRALVAAAHAAGVAVTVANPRQVRALAEGLGRRAKTDPIDAESLYDFGRLTTPRADVAPSPAQTALAELVVARQQAVLERSTLTLQSASHQLPLLKALARARLKLLSAQIAKIEATLAKTLAAEQALAAQAARLAEVPGVGPLTAATALALCPELGTLTRGEAAALLGVAPFNHDSGQCQGQRHIAGGRYRLRCAIYMAALSAARANPILRAFYQRLRAAGKPAKLASPPSCESSSSSSTTSSKIPISSLRSKHSCFDCAPHLHTPPPLFPLHPPRSAPLRMTGCSRPARAGSSSPSCSICTAAGRVAHGAGPALPSP